MSLTRTLANFARACGGQLRGADARFTDVVSDSRTLEAGQEIGRASCRERV